MGCSYLRALLSEVRVRKRVLLIIVIVLILLATPTLYINFQTPLTKKPEEVIKLIPENYLPYFRSANETVHLCIDTKDPVINGTLPQFGHYMRTDVSGKYHAVYLAPDAWYGLIPTAYYSKLARQTLRDMLISFGKHFDDDYGIPVSVYLVNPDLPEYSEPRWIWAEGFMGGGGQAFVTPAWVILVYYYYLLTHDRDFLVQVYPTVVKAILWCLKYSDNHLLAKYPNPYGGLEDWAENRGVSTVLQCFYYRALVSAARIGQIMGSRFTSYFSLEAYLVKKETNNVLLMNDHYATYIDSEGTVWDFRDTASQLYPILFGVAEEAVATKILKWISESGLDKPVPCLWYPEPLPADHLTAGPHYGNGKSAWIGRLGAPYVVSKILRGESVDDLIQAQCDAYDRNNKAWWEWYDENGNPGWYPARCGEGQAEAAGGFLMQLLTLYDPQFRQLMRLLTVD